MHRNASSSGSESRDSSNERPAASRATRLSTVGDRRLDRRKLIRGAGPVLLASFLAGCYHDEGSDGGGDDGGGGDGGGGAYDVDGPPASRG